MSRCDEFYRKWEECGNFCEKHPETARKIELYLDLIREHPPIGGLTEGTLRPLIREKDAYIREKVIESIKNSVESGKNPVTGEFTRKPITSKDVQQLITRIHDTRSIAPHMTPLMLLETVVSIIECPQCNERFELIHVERNGTHKLRKLDGKEVVKGMRITDDEDLLLDEIARISGKTRSLISREAINTALEWLKEAQAKIEATEAEKDHPQKEGSIS